MSNNDEADETTKSWVKRYKDAAEPPKAEDIAKMVEERKDDPKFLKAVKKYVEKA